MSDGITRRRFVAHGAALGATAALGGVPWSGGARSTSAAESHVADLAAITGPDGYDNTIAAVAAVGGMERFVPSGASVIINANTAFKHRGSIVDPDVLLAVLTLCTDAGAGEIHLVKAAGEGYWDRCARAVEAAAIIDRARISEREFTVVTLERGVVLKEAHVDRRLLAADVYLNVAIAKHHKGCDYTGALKNAMGACPHDPTCRFFHVGTDPDSESWYPDLDHLSQCIADLNTLRTPDLCILDAGEILLTNGPFGPGKLATPRTVVASSDPVAADAYGVRFLGRDPRDVAMIERSNRLGLGSARLDSIRVFERDTP